MKSKLLTLTVVALFVLFGTITLFPAPTSAVTNQTLVCGSNTVQIPGPRIPETGFANQGDTLKIVEVTVPTELQGKNVPASAEITNVLSVRSGSNITIESNGTSFVLNDVESAPNKVTTASGPLTLGGTVDVILTFGVGGLFSGGGLLTITIDCPSPPPPTVPPVTPPEGGRGGEVLPPKVVEVPKVVSAGAGGTMETNLAAVFGLTGSLAMLGLGLRRLNKDVL